MPILPNGSKPTTLTIGGSPRGWTFLGAAACWRRWALRYLVGLFPLTRKGYFDLGSAYHALMEGQPVERVRAEFPEHIDEAMRLRDLRMKGPPLSAAKALEHEYAIFDGLMTSKPDREEAGYIRDYKSSMTFSENDDKAWNVDPGILGEMVAGNVTKGIVDIVSKRTSKDGDAPDKPVKLVDVTLTEAKRRALEVMVREFWRQLGERLKAVSEGAGVDFPRGFPANLGACVGKYGPCDYYDRCWGKLPESAMYKLAPNPPRRWVTGREDMPLKLPKGITKKLIDAAYREALIAWFNKEKP